MTISSTPRRVASDNFKSLELWSDQKKLDEMVKVKNKQIKHQNWTKDHHVTWECFFCYNFPEVQLIWHDLFSYSLTSAALSPAIILINLFSTDCVFFSGIGSIVNNRDSTRSLSERPYAITRPKCWFSVFHFWRFWTYSRLNLWIVEKLTA